MIRKKKVLITIISIIVLFFIVDFSLVKNNKSPIFVIKISTEKDGGTKTYLGIGYKIIKYNVMGNDGKVINDNYKIGTWFMKY